MNGFARKVARLVVVALIALFAVGSLAACGKEQKRYGDSIPTPSASSSSEAQSSDPTLADKAKDTARRGVNAVGYGSSWILQLLIIMGSPLVVLLIPGKGKIEKVIEGIALVAIGIFEYNLAKEMKMPDIGTYAVWVNIIPGVLLFIWGVVSGKGEGKIFLMGGVSALFAIFLFFKGFRLFSLGLVYQPLLTMLLAFIALAIVGRSLKKG